MWDKTLVARDLSRRPATGEPNRRLVTRQQDQDQRAAGQEAAGRLAGELIQPERRRLLKQN